MTGPVPLRLVVVGGGYTGVVLVIHAVRAAARPLAVTVVEPAAELGRGLAYGTADPAHRINVPSDRMGLSADDPGEATRWFFDHGVLPDADSADGEGHFYVPRHAYGSFVMDVLRRTLEDAGSRVRFTHRRAAVRAVVRAGDGWRVATDDGGAVEADSVALCFGHAVPHLPCPIGPEVGRSAKFVPDPWAPGAFDAIADADAVLVVGTGLTMADVVAGLRARGHAGPITAVSRRGLTSRPHGRFGCEVDILEGKAPPTTALGLLRLVRERVRAHPDLGWHPVADALRPDLPVIWNALPAPEKARVLRRLLPFWDVHRFRIAPQVHDALERDRDGGSLAIEQAGLVGLEWAGGRLTATLRKPGGRREERAFDAVVLCTGPEKDLRGNPLVASLLDGGLARLDDTGLGLAVDLDSRVLDRDGRTVTGLFAFGPMTRGSFGEMTGAPDIAKHVERIAADVVGGDGRPRA